MSETKFKVGDRVRVYDHQFTRTGEVIEVGPHHLYVCPDDSKRAFMYQAKQCRRLRPKRKARVWTCFIDGLGHLRDSAALHAGMTFTPIVVREVLPKKDPK